MDMYTLLYLKWITNRDIPIPIPVTNVKHIEFCSVLCGSLDGWGVWGRMDPCVFMAESLCCLPETITLFVNWLYLNTK